MKIEAIRLLGQPRRMLCWALVEVRCDDGITGIGMTSAPPATIDALISCPSSGMARLLVGRDPRDVNSLMHLLVSKWQAERGRGEEGGLAINAAAAIEQGQLLRGLVDKTAGY